MAKVILYSTGCPQCKALKAMLDKKHIQYEVCSDVDTMIKLGMSSVPVLETDGKRMEYLEAQTWVKQNMEATNEKQ